MKKTLKIIAIAVSLSSFSAIGSDASKLTAAERQLMIGSAYLSQCAIKSSDFKAIAATFDPKYVRPFGRSQSGRLKFYDSSAATMIHLSDDSCIVEIVTQEFEKFVKTVPVLITVLGGELKLEEGEDGYSGIVTLDGEAFTVRAFSDGLSKDNIVTGAIIRQP